MLFDTFIPRFGRLFRSLRRRRRREPPAIPSVASSASNPSIEVQETSFSGDIELIQVSDSSPVSCTFRVVPYNQRYLFQVHLIEMEGRQYCQAIQQGADGNYEAALFADLRSPLLINNAGKNRDEHAPRILKIVAI